MEMHHTNSPFRGTNSFSRHLRITQCFNDFFRESRRRIFVLIKCYPQTQEANVRCGGLGDSEHAGTLTHTHTLFSLLRQDAPTPHWSVS